MNYALVLLALGIIVKYVYENVPDSIYMKLGKPLKALFLVSMIASMGCGVGSIVLSFAQPISADSDVSDVSVYEQQIATLQVQLEDYKNQLATVNATLETLQNNSSESETKIEEESADSVKDEKSNEKEELEDKETVKVVSDVYFRSKASSSSKVYSVLRKGTKLEVLGTTGSWLKVKYKGTTGYVSKRFCEGL